MNRTAEINTERLQLRKLHLDDAKAIFDYRSDSITNKYQGWVPDTINDVYDFINNKVASELNITDTWYQLVVIKKEDQKIIGDIGIHFLKPDNKQVEIGCTLSKKEQGRGLMTEALTAVINYLFGDLGKHKIAACIDPDNIKSIALFERLGFKKEESFQLIREYPDDLVYAILKDDWFRRS